MKVYQKPEIKIENFALSESIALTCTWVIQSDGKYKNEGMDGITLFAAETGCTVNEGEDFCLTNMSDVMGEQTSTSY